jgi:site-specific DNA recombinase
MNVMRGRTAMPGAIGMKAVGYIRVSTPDQAREGESLRTQREAIEKFAQGNGWALVQIYSDEGISGAKKNRPALDALLEDAERKKFEFVIIHRLSRFGRNACDLLNNVETLKENGIKLLSVKDGIDYSTSYGQAMLTMLAAIAQLERDIIDEQMRENKMAKWKDHRIVIGRLPLGYDWDEKKKEIVLNPKEAEIYQRMVSIYLNEGKSFCDIAEELNRDSVKPRRARKWTSSVISYVLKNSIYYGRYVVNRLEYDGKKRTKIRKPESEHIVWELGDHLQLISKTRWDAIQEKTAFNKRKGKHIKISEEYFLRDVLVCGECGGVIKPRHGVKKKDGSQPRYYACYWRWTSKKELRDKGTERCILPFQSADEIEEYVWYYLMSYLSLQRLDRGGRIPPYDNLFDSNQYDSRIKRLSETIDEVEREIKKNERMKERLFGLLEEEQYRKDDFLKKLRSVEDRIFFLVSKRNDYLQETRELEEAKDNDRVYKEFIDNRKGFLTGLLTGLQGLSAQDKKLLVEGMLRERIKIYAEDGGEEIGFSGPKLRFNKEILIRLINEGKIEILDIATRHPLREHRLAAPGGAREKEGMGPGGRDFQGSASHRLSDDIPEVRPAGLAGVGERPPSFYLRPVHFSGQGRRRVAQRLRGDDLQAGNQRGLLAIVERDDNPGKPGLPREEGLGEDAPHRLDGTVEGELSPDQVAPQGVRGDKTLRAKERKGDRKVEECPVLAQVGGGEVDGDLSSRVREPRVADGGAHPVRALANRAPRQPHDREGGKSFRNVGFHLHGNGVDPRDGGSENPDEQTAAPFRGGPLPPGIGAHKRITQCFLR